MKLAHDGKEKNKEQNCFLLIIWAYYAKLVSN